MTEALQRTARPAGIAAGERERVSLGLGAVVIATRPSIVRTVLGSCVAVILHVPRLKSSALCHAQMPERYSEGCCRGSCPKPCTVDVPVENEFRFVTCCVRRMVRELHRLRASNKEMVATLVGGGNVLANLDPRWSVASRNVSVAQAMLERYRIPLTHADIGGTRGRVIEHFSDLNLTRVRYHGSAR